MIDAIGRNDARGLARRDGRTNVMVGIATHPSNIGPEAAVAATNAARL
jgi:hypothetical protein